MYIMDIDLMVFYIFNNGILKNIVYVLSNIDSSATFVNIYIFYCFPIFIKKLQCSNENTNKYKISHS